MLFPPTIDVHVHVWSMPYRFCILTLWQQIYDVRVCVLLGSWFNTCTCSSMFSGSHLSMLWSYLLKMLHITIAWLYHDQVRISHSFRLKLLGVHYALWVLKYCMYSVNTIIEPALISSHSWVYWHTLKLELCRASACTELCKPDSSMRWYKVIWWPFTYMCIYWEEVVAHMAVLGMFDRHDQIEL